MGELDDKPEVTAEEIAQEPTKPKKLARLFGKLNPRHFSRKKMLIVSSSLVVVLALLFFVEPLKFSVLNIFTKTSSQFLIVDDTTLRPIENAKISVAGKEFKTNKDGKATASKIKFGTFTYKISRDGYYALDGKAKATFGNVLVGPLKLKSSGIPVTFKVTNKLSTQAVASYKVTLADSTTVTATSDKDGTAILNVPTSKVGDIEVVMSADGFNDSRQKITVADTPTNAVQNFQLTPAGKTYFLSNRSGKIDVYASNLDGTDQTVVVAGKGTEDATTYLDVSPDNTHAIMISRRDNQKDASGKPLSALYAIDLEQKTIKRIDEGAPQFAMLGWVDNSTIIYTVGYDSYDRADNSKIKRAVITTGELSTIYAQPGYTAYYYFQEDKKNIYFPSSDTSKVLYGLIRLDLATKKTTIVDKAPIYTSLSQVEPNSFVYTNNDNNKTYSYSMITQSLKQTDPIDYTDNEIYSYSPSFEKSAWIEVRDGKGIVVVGDKQGKNEEATNKNMNASQLVTFYGENYIIYTVSTSSEHAYYILDIASGTTTKISDVYAASMRGY